MLSIKLLLVVAAAAGSATFVCPPCETVSGGAPVVRELVAAQPTDTATARLHISGMTCGTCPVTARLALKKLAGVYDAKVTLDDSLGVVRYNPRRVTPAHIAAQLTRLTGYGARVVADSSNMRRPSGE